MTMTVAEAGRKGGKTTSERRGRDFYREIGRKGGTATAEAYGHEHFVAIGTKGGARIKELIQKAKEAARDSA